MDKNNASCFVFSTHTKAEEAIRSLSSSGFDVKKLSLIGKGYHTEERPLGFYTVGDRIKAWGGVGAFWGSIWGILLTPAVFVLPGLGLMAMSGPIVAALVSALEGAVVIGGLSALGAALTQIGVSKNQILKYETALRADKFLLMVHGDGEDIAKASALLAADKKLLAA